MKFSILTNDIISSFLNRKLNEFCMILKIHKLYVDITYPDHLYEAHRDFPLAPEKRDITKEMLSDEM